MQRPLPSLPRYLRNSYHTLFFYKTGTIYKQTFFCGEGSLFLCECSQVLYILSFSNLYDKIFKDKNAEHEFLVCIKAQLCCFKHNGEDIPGGKVVAGFHRSGPIYKAWSSWKEKWSNKK